MVDIAVICPNCDKSTLTLFSQSLIKRMEIRCEGCGHYVRYEEIERGYYEK